MQWEENRTNFDRNLVVVIGINLYKNDSIHNLSTPVSDASTFADLLETEYGYNKDKIGDRLFDKNVVCLFDEAATITGLQTLLSKTIPEQLKPTKSDRLIFYYAGHGIPRNSKDGPAGYLVPQDADLNKADSFLSMQYVYDQLTKLDCHHLLVILDCCFAGTFQWAGSRKLISMLETVRREHYDRFIRFPAWQVITSSAHDQEAMDIALDNTVLAEDSRGTVTNSSHSPFALALIEGLKDNRADLIPDGVITAHELYLYLEQRVSELSKQRQNPGLYPLRREYDRGEFIFTKPGFKRDKLKPAPPLDENNNPYRGLKSFDEKHAGFFFGRQALIEELAKRLLVPNQPLAVVLGVSGSGKSSLVKAGLIPYLRDKQAKQWYVLEPMRPGELPFTSLARVLLPIVNTNLLEQLSQVSFLDEALKQVLKFKTEADQDLGRADQAKSESDRPFQMNETLIKVAQSWCSATPEARLLLVEDYLAQLETLCRPEEQQILVCLHDEILARLDSLLGHLQQDPHYLIAEIETWSQNHPDIKLLLVIDQFEELITASHEGQTDSRGNDETGGDRTTELKQWQPFLEMLRGAIAGCPHLWRVVLTLRSDFEPRFLDSLLKPYWNDARFPVRAMNSDELRQAIEGPALKQALYFEPPELVGKLIDEVGQMPGALPLLSFTLSELYIKLRDRWTKDNASDRALRIKDYEELGGVAGALTRRATQEYDNLLREFGEESGKAYQATMRRVMLRMVAIEGGEVARRRVPKSELVYADSAENNRVVQVSNRLVKARLLVKGQETGEPYVEPAHDFLVRGWDKLQKWIEEEQASLFLRQRLTIAANVWIRRTGSLWVEESDRLIELNEVIKSNKNWLNRLETVFVKRSSKVRQDRIKKLEEDLRISEERRVNAELREKVARVESLLPLQPLDAITLAIAAIGQNLKELPNEILSSVQSSLRKAMNIARERNSFKAHEGIVEHVGFSPAGKQVVSRSYSFRAKPSNSFMDNFLEPIQLGIVTQDKYDEVVRLWNEEGNCTHELLKDENHKFLSFTSDGQEIVTVSPEGVLYLWALDGSLIDSFFIGSIDLSPNINSTTISSSSRQRIVRGNDDGTINVWELPQDSESKLNILTFQAHRASISSIILSSDGQQIASGSVDGMIGLWDLQGNPVIDQFCGHKSQVLAIAISLDKQHIVGGNVDGSICICDVRNKRIEFFQVCEAEIASVALSFDGKQFAAGTNDGIVYVQSIQGKPTAKLNTGHEKKVSFVAFNSLEGIDERLKSKNALLDITFAVLAGWITESSIIKNIQKSNPLHKLSNFRKKRIVAGSIDGAIQIWDLNGNSCGKPFIGYASRLSIGFSPDAQRIVALFDGKLRSWDLEGNLISEAFNRHKDGVLSATFSPNRQMIVSGGSDGTVCLWDGWGNLINQLLKGNEYAPIPADLTMGGVEGLGTREVEAFNFKNRINSLSFSSDGQKIVSGSYNGTIHIWDAETDLIHSFETLKVEVEAVAFSNDGQQIIASSTHGKIHSWNLQGDLLYESILERPDGLSYRQEQPIAFNCDKHQVVSGGREWVGLWNINGKLIANPFKYSSFGPTDTLSVVFSPDGYWIASASDDRARLWSLRGDSIVKILHGHTGKALAFSPDSQRIAGSSHDNTINLWDINGEPVGKPLQGQQSAALSIAFSRDGKIVSGGENGTLHLWDSESKPIGQPLFGHTGKILSVAFSCDGKWIVSGSDDNTIRLWDINGNLIGEPLRGHQAGVSSVAFSPDGQLIVSGSRDKTVRLWQAGNWENWLQVCCNRLYHHSTFRNPEQIENLEQRQIAIKACEICQKYVW